MPISSLPVMFEAPSGTNLLHGADIEIPKPSSEFLPFTDAGMITVTFGIDGDMPKFITEEAGEFTCPACRMPTRSLQSQTQGSIVESLRSTMCSKGCSG